MTKIVNFLKETSLTPGQITKIKSMGELLEVPEGATTEEQAMELIKGADFAIFDPTTVSYVSRKILEASQNLKGIVINTTNVNWVDMGATKELGVRVMNSPGFSTESVAELVIGLIFAVARKISLAARDVKVKNVISLHLALTDETKEFIGQEEFKLMKDGVILINVSREELIDQAALLGVLKNKKLFWYGFDMNEEPWIETRRAICALDNVVATPHIGWFTRESRARSMEMVVAKLEQLVANSGK